MLHEKHLRCFYSDFDSSKQTKDYKKFEDFLNEIGEEKIVQVVCGGLGVSSVMYTIIYRD